jgi:hypothetical protein
MTYIIGVDPGKSMGIAVMDFPAIVDVYQGDPINGVIFLRNALRRLEHISREDDREFRAYVACERFVILPGSGRRSKGGGNTQALVGRVEEIVSEFPGASFYLQNVSDASRFDNNMLRRLELYVSSRQVGCVDANDANSAVRHILLFMARNRADLLDKLVTTAELM